MSYFEALQIQGIRSFGPEEQDKGLIRFGHPLTLILGNNGCGKTTIIEALNCATTGDLPPGCSGAGQNSSFIYDPKLTNRSEVKGQVRLTMRDVTGKKLCVSRTMQVIQKQVQTQFKRLDQSVSCEESDGNWKSISGKCADVNNVMCFALGVSKAIISNVLLCHQEDSNWPLSEDSKVKGKFDEIFGSEKYNNCLEEIKSSMKQLTLNQKEYKEKLEHLSLNKSDAASIRTRLEQAEQRLVVCQNQIVDVDVKLTPIQRELRQLAEKENEFLKLRSNFEKRNAELNAVVTAIQELRGSIQKEFKGSTTELNETIRNFSLALSEKESNLEDLEAKSVELEMRLARNAEALSTEQKRYGQLEGEFRTNERKIEMRSRAIISLAKELGISTADLQLSDANQFHRLITDLEQAVILKETEIEETKKKQDEIISSLRAEMANCRDKKVTIENGVKANNDKLLDNKKQLKKVLDDISEADKSFEILGKLQSQLDAVKKQYDEMMRSNEIDDLKSKISSNKMERDNLESALHKLEIEVSELQLLTQTRAQLEMQSAARADKEAAIKKLLSRHEMALIEILQISSLPKRGIKSKLDAKMKEINEEIKENRESLRKIENQKAAKEAEIRFSVQKLKEAKQELESDEFELQQACEGRDYDSYTAEVRTKLDDLLNEKGALSSAEQFYRKYVVKLQKTDPCCPVCHRGFSAVDEATKLVSELTLKSREVPSKLRKNKEQLEKIQSKYETLVQLKQKRDKVAALKTTKIPILETNLESATKELAKLKQSEEELNGLLDGPQILESMGKNMQNDVCLLEQYLTEVERLSEEVVKIENKLTSGTGSKKTLEEAVNEQNEMRGSLQKCRQRVDELENRLKSVEARKDRLREEKHSLQERKCNINDNVQGRAQLSQKRDALEASNVDVQQELHQLQQDMVDILRLQEQHNKKLKNTQEMNTVEMNKLNQEYKNVENQFDKIKNLSQEIVNYECSGGLKKLNLCKEAVDNFYKAKDQLDNEKRETAAKMDGLKKDLSDQNALKRDLLDNVKLRSKMVEETDLVVKVEHLKREIGDMDSVGLCKERERLQKSQTDLFSKKKEAEGSLMVLESTIQSLKEDMRKPHLLNAEKNFREATVAHEVIGQAKIDLSLFYEAMTWAMFNYHTKKINHINTVINELWRKVYAGNDIDSIKIVSESDKEKNKATSSRRTFKYRVVQVKNGTEIDMRNRCSAGQKVLACLIIRMALAETFSSQCGVLALDEPTTNLDQDNIQSLCKVLQRLVHLQQLKKNFQLLVITHDEYFLKELSNLDGIDHYYKLDRTYEGKSKVIKMHIN